MYPLKFESQNLILSHIHLLHLTFNLKYIILVTYEISIELLGRRYMRWYVLNADARDPDCTKQPYGGLASGSLKRPALAGQRAGPDHGASTEALAAHPRSQHVERPAHRRLVDHMLYSVTRVQYSCTSRF